MGQNQRRRLRRLCRLCTALHIARYFEVLKRQGILGGRDGTSHLILLGKYGGRATGAQDVQRGLQADAGGSFRIREDAAESLDGYGSELLVLIAPEQDFFFTGAAEGSAEVGRIAAPVEYGIAVYAGRFGRGDHSGTCGDLAKDSFLSRSEDVAVLGSGNRGRRHLKEFLPIPL